MANKAYSDLKEKGEVTEEMMKESDLSERLRDPWLSELGVQVLY